MAMLYMLYIARKNNNARHRLTGSESTKLMADVYKDYNLFENEIILLKSKNFINIDGSPIYTHNGPQYSSTDIVITEYGYNYVVSDIATFTKAYSLF